MRNSLICLPLLVLSASMLAQEINAPEPRWPEVMAAANVSETGTTEQNPAEQSAAFKPGALSDPITQPSNAGETSAPPEAPLRRQFIACAPNLAVVDDGEDIPPLRPHDKFRIFYRQFYNPCRYFGAAFAAGISQARNSLSGYGQGAEGYGKRVGANLADGAVASLFGRALLPTLLHDDPRYFRLGSSASFKRRLLHAALSPEWTRRDNGSHRFNYSRVGGDFIAAGIANAYYPDTDRGAGHTFKHAGTMLGEASAAAVFQEFWPDIKRKFKKKNTAEPPK